MTNQMAALLEQRSDVGDTPSLFLAPPRPIIPDARPLGTIAVTVRSGISKQLTIK